MKKYLFAFVFSLVLFGFGLVGYGQMLPPPPLAVQGPPDVVVVPSEQYPDDYVYMVPNSVGVYVYEGFWYRNYNGNWFRSPAYNGVWASVGISILPPIILSIPLEYALFLPSGYHRIHYSDYHTHWREWENDRYWSHKNWYKEEMRADIRRDRMRHIESYRTKGRNNSQTRERRPDNVVNERGGGNAERPGVNKEKGRPSNQPMKNNQSRQQMQMQQQPRQQGQGQGQQMQMQQQPRQQGQSQGQQMQREQQSRQPRQGQGQQMQSPQQPRQPRQSQGQQMQREQQSRQPEHGQQEQKQHNERENERH